MLLRLIQLVVLVGGHNKVHIHLCQWKNPDWFMNQYGVNSHNLYIESVERFFLIPEYDSIWATTKNSLKLRNILWFHDV